MFNLLAWLRRAPRPKRLRVKEPDGEWKFIEIPSGRRWSEVLQTVKTADATAVECLGAEGNVLRAMKLSEEDTDSEDFESAATAVDKGATRAMQAQAVMLDAYGRRLNEAFARGAAAASSSQDKLVQLVDDLTGHLTLAITNLHNISTNYANVVASQATDDNPNAALLQGVLGLALGGGPARPATPDPNGKKGK